MSERYSREDHERYRKQVDDAERREQEERRRAAREAAKASWTAAGGSGRAFDEAFDAQEVEQAAATQRERREAARQYSRRFSEI